MTSTNSFFDVNMLIVFESLDALDIFSMDGKNIQGYISGIIGSAQYHKTPPAIRFTGYATAASISALYHYIAITKGITHCFASISSQLIERQ